MANYYPFLANIIAALENSSAELRRRIYENARTGFLEQMRKHDPPLADAHITQEQISFEEAIRKVEAEQMARQRAVGSAPRIDFEVAAPVTASTHPVRARGRLTPR